MLISKDDIKKYLNSIPNMQEHIKLALKYLNEGNIQLAAAEVEKDTALKYQLQTIINSAYFSLTNKVSDTLQIFTLLGIEMSKNIIYSYLVNQLQPKEWKIFKKLNFNAFQAIFLSLYEKWMLIEFDKKTYKEFSTLGALIPISVAVTDSLLADKSEKVDIILESTAIEIGSLIKRLTGISLFEIASKIAEIWDINQKQIEILKQSECIKCENRISALIHLLLFYIVSKPQFYELNGLIEFNPNSVKMLKKIERIIYDK